LEQTASHSRVGQQFFQCLLVGQGIEELLILHGGGKELSAFFRRQRIRCETAEEFFEFVFCHGPLV
jgi:hypothetical protein